jgi:hypothetical protein
MGNLDLLMADCQGYRQHIIYSLEQDDLTNTMAYIEGFYFIMLPHVHRPPEMNQRPNTTGVPWERAHIIETKWVLSNLRIVETQMFARFVYRKKLPFIILQGVMTMYRQSTMFNLDHKRDPEIAAGLVEILNGMMPEGNEAVFPGQPTKGIYVSSDYNLKMRKWVRDCLVGFEYNLSLYLKKRMAVQQH